MTKTQGAGNCRWAVPTLTLESPAWADAEDRPWTCTRDETPEGLESTTTCESCVRWEQQPARPSASGEGGTRPAAEPYLPDEL